MDPYQQTVNMDLTSWSPGERLWLWRKSHGLNQHEAAIKLRTHVSSYRLKEQGNDRTPEDWLDRAKPRFREPPAGLLCMLARRRWGKTLREVAKEHGCSHTTLLKLECGKGDKRLVSWYERMGFKFV